MTPAIPEIVRRQLRQEARFGCAACGFPFVEYHHIIPLAVEVHNRPKDMVALCPNCHHKAHKLDERDQRAWKRNPYNAARGYAQGALIFSHRTPAVSIGANLLIGNGPKLVADGVTLLAIRVDKRGRLLVSIDLRGRSGEQLLLVVDNEWVSGGASIWDLEFKQNYLRIRNGLRKITLEIDATTVPLVVCGSFVFREGEFGSNRQALWLKRRAPETSLTVSDLCLVFTSISTDAADTKIEGGEGFGAIVSLTAPSAHARWVRCIGWVRTRLLERRIGMKSPFPCGSGNKFKHCCSSLLSL